MANAIQKYAANKACCIATNVQKTDNKIKYGAEDMICCINKDFIANTFVELLMCNSVPKDSSWYVMTITLVFTDGVPSSVPGNIIIPDTIITSYDGQMTTILPTAGVYTITSMLDFNSQLYDVYSTIESSDPSVILETLSFNDVTGQMVANLYYTSKWGGLDTPPTFSTTFPASNPLGTTVSYSFAEATINTDSCLTSLQLCSIKEWLDNYCQSC